MREEDRPSGPREASTTEGLPVAPSLGPTLDAVHARARATGIDRRVLVICALSIAVAVAAGLIARMLTGLIGLITNLSFYGRFDTSFASPAGNHLGLFVIVVPIAGAILVGFMARYGSKAIRGHGIPEAMEQVLFNESRIPARMTFLKPLSAAIAIGTGGPFGAEGPIIATGGALGLLVGQLLKTTPDERKTLLAAGAAAGMAATFGSPVSAVLLAIELLLFEYRPRSIIPVALATVTATGVRIALAGAAPVFPMPDLAPPSGAALASYALIGAIVGAASVYVTKLVYWVEDAFEKLPVHWMWWPAIGAVAVGVCGFLSPHTLGVGYDNIEHIVSGELAGKAMIVVLRGEARLLVDLRSEAGPREARWRRSSRSAAGSDRRSASCCRESRPGWRSTFAWRRWSGWPPSSRAHRARSSRRSSSRSRPPGSQWGSSRSCAGAPSRTWSRACS